jgi:aldehyde dehydrogenase family protein
MVASIKPHRDEVGLSDGLMLIDGTWSAAQDGTTWDHSHTATQLEPHAAFGGYRQSGLGREGGRAAIEAYTELKTVLLPFTDQMM